MTTSQSPQRTRKVQGHSGSGGQPPREMSPSPVMRERQRTIKAQSMPLVPSVMQMYTNPPPSQRPIQQPSPPMSSSSIQSKRSPPPTSQVPPSSKLASPPHTADIREHSPGPLTPPPPMHTHSQTNIHHQPPPMPPHSHSQPNIPTHGSQNPSLGYPRPINRIPPPPFLMDKNWELTEELLADIERADLQQAQGARSSPSAGTAGVAYAGGYSRVEAASPPRDPGVERVRASERSSPKEFDSAHNSGNSAGRRREREVQRESPKIRERIPQTLGQASTAPQYAPQSQNQVHTPERRGSPQYQAPLASPGEHTASYTQYKLRDSYQSASLPPQRVTTPPLVRRGSITSAVSETMRTTPPVGSRFVNQTPPIQNVTTRTPDRSLPVQEEAEDDPSTAKDGSRERWDGLRHEHDIASPAPSSDLHPEGHSPRYDQSYDHQQGRDSRIDRKIDDDDETLIEHDDDDDDQRSRSRDGRDDEDSGHTPRSPTVDLPEDIHQRLYVKQNANRAPLPVKHRNGTMDQLGLRGIDTSTFDSIKNKPKSAPLEYRPAEIEQTQRYISPPHQPYARYNDIQIPEHGQRYFTPGPTAEDIQSYLEDPATAYIQAYLQSPRPNAPIPPTPHSHTAAPSPSPLVSAIQSDAGKELPPFSPAPPVGSPYPYPFSHVRRTHTYSGHTNLQAPSTNYDPNHPSIVQEQLALQMQMYALNNHAPLSDSTLSPSSTPFPAPGYNPWAFMQARLLGNRQRDSTMSLQSSPSHEPLPLPLPPMRGRGLKKRDRAINLREQQSTVTRQKKIPPPRVESTQPRETSPEPYSSGEETAGEDKYEVAAQDGGWVSGNAPEDDGDWVDEDEEEGEDDDLLELEYHPSFVSNVEKRRRRWETRWEALIQAFQALDRQTDTTLVLLASPSHSTKLHSLTSRSIRRDPSLSQSAAFSQIRSSFRHIASSRRSTRSHKSSLADRLLSISAGSSGDGSDGSSESREEDLRRALEAALGSLGAVGELYHQREARWREEMRKVSDEREKVHLLLQQTLGLSALGSGSGREL